MPSFIYYDQWLKSQFNGAAIDFDDPGTILVAAVAAGYTPNRGNDAIMGLTVRAGTNHELAGTNYTAGGHVAGSLTVTVSTATHKVTIAHDDVLFTAHVDGLAGIETLVWWRPSDSALIGYMSLGAAYTTTAADLTIDIPASGIMTIG